MIYSAHSPVSFHRGIAHIVLIGAVAIVGLVIVGFATGTLKGSFKISKSEPQTQNESQSQEAVNTGQNSTDKQTEKPSPTPQALGLSKTYTNNNLKMQINYPENWTVNETNTGANIYAPGTDVNSAAKSDAAVIVSSSPLGNMKGLALTTLADVMKNQMGSFLPGAIVISTSTAKIGNHEAYVYYLDYYNKGQNYPSVFYLLTDDENLYGVITSVSEAKKSTYEQTFKAIVDTFQII